MSVYQFNPITGRLKQSSFMQGLYPISARKLSKADPPTIVWDKKPTFAKTPMQSKARFSTVDSKTLAKFKKFQENIDEPVYLKGGTKDKILFGITVVLVIGGVIDSLIFLVKMANSKS